jgi:hypothetical protein
MTKQFHLRAGICLRVKINRHREHKNIDVFIDVFIDVPYGDPKCHEQVNDYVRLHYPDYRLMGYCEAEPRCPGCGGTNTEAIAWLPEQQQCLDCKAAWERK